MRSQAMQRSLYLYLCFVFSSSNEGALLLIYSYFSFALFLSLSLSLPDSPSLSKSHRIFIVFQRIHSDIKKKKRSNVELLTMFFSITSVNCLLLFCSAFLTKSATTINTNSYIRSNTMDDERQIYC